MKQAPSQWQCQQILQHLEALPYRQRRQALHLQPILPYAAPGRRLYSNPENLRLVVLVASRDGLIRIRDACRALDWTGPIVWSILNWGVRNSFVDPVSHRIYRVRQLPPIEVAARTDGATPVLDAELPRALPAGDLDYPE